MSKNNQYKNLVQEEIEALEDKIIQINDKIHANPELGLKEYRACELLTSEIKKFDFEVNSPVADLNTAFTATYNGKKEGPHIGFLAEYDALPVLGHACGHNIIAASSFGAAVALKRVASQLGGTVSLYGTPNEEGYGMPHVEGIDIHALGGKVFMVESGLLDHLDAAIMMHPIGGASKVWDYTFPSKAFKVKYVGKPAHYTEYYKGINALESLLAFLNNVKALKSSWTPDVLFAYTITNGGGPSPIVVPESAEAFIVMKTFYANYLEDLYREVRVCAENTAFITSSKVEIKEVNNYKNMMPNLNLVRSLYKNLKTLGAEVETPSVSQRALERRSYPGGSTDFGDVSWVTPSIHGYISIGNEDLVLHTREAAEAAGSTPGHKAAILAAKAMAMTGVDILADSEFAKKIQEEFQEYKKGEFLNVPGIPPNYAPFPKEFLKEIK